MVTILLEVALAGPSRVVQLEPDNVAFTAVVKLELDVVAVTADVALAAVIAPAPMAVVSCKVVGLPDESEVTIGTPEAAEVA